jgi:hypothetical protein
MVHTFLLAEGVSSVGGCICLCDGAKGWAQAARKAVAACCGKGAIPGAVPHVMCS